MFLQAGYWRKRNLVPRAYTQETSEEAAGGTSQGIAGILDAFWLP
jgi:hypothetical protein